jgi:hypothetical protein
MEQRSRSRVKQNGFTTFTKKQQEIEKRIPNAKLARTLIFDIETRPILAYVWGRWQQDVLRVVEDREILCVGWKWLGERTVHCLGVWDFKGYRPGKTDQDWNLCKVISTLFDEADIVVAHNGKSFDVPIVNARIAHYDYKPGDLYSPFRQIDTKVLASRKMGFTSNSLKDLAIAMGLTPKLDPGGIQTWLDVMAGDEKAQAKMVRYNKRDIVTLEEIYLKLRPFDSYHPNIAVASGIPLACPICGGGTNPRGWRYLKAYRARQYRCESCGHTSQGEREKLSYRTLTA